jgi:hypothetical protein
MKSISLHFFNKKINFHLKYGTYLCSKLRDLTINRKSLFRLQFTDTQNVYQYSETNMMHFLFNLLRIKGLYMFRALPAHPQEFLHKLHLVYCVRIMSVGCIRIVVELSNPGAAN